MIQTKNHNMRVGWNRRNGDITLAQGERRFFIARQRGTYGLFNGSTGMALAINLPTRRYALEIAVGALTGEDSSEQIKASVDRVEAFLHRKRWKRLRATITGLATKLGLN